MFSTDDTIVALSTPPGRSGIGVVRRSGQEARRIAESLLGAPGALEARRAHPARSRHAPGK